MEFSPTERGGEQHPGCDEETALLPMPVCSPLPLPLPQADESLDTTELSPAELLIFSTWVLSIGSKFREESSGL